jgi:tetratricopeptide (TPR) repeat protein
MKGLGRVVKSGWLIVLLLVVLLAGGVVLQYGIDGSADSKPGWKDSSPFDTANSVLDVLGGVRETIAAYMWTKTDEVFHEYLNGDISKEDALYPYFWMITRLDPHFTMPYYFASWTLARMGQVDQGFELAIEGLRNNPYSARLQENLAYMYLFFKKDPRKARYHILKAIELTTDKQQKAVYLSFLDSVNQFIAGKRAIPEIVPLRQTTKMHEELEQHEGHEHH